MELKEKVLDKGFVEVVVDLFGEFIHVLLEKMIRSFDDPVLDLDILLLLQFLDQLVDRRLWYDVVLITVNDDAVCGTRCQKRKIVHIRWGCDRDEALDLRAPHQ